MTQVGDGQPAALASTPKDPLEKDLTNATIEKGDEQQVRHTLSSMCYVPLFLHRLLSKTTCLCLLAYGFLIHFVCFHLPPCSGAKFSVVTGHCSSLLQNASSPVKSPCKSPKKKSKKRGRPPGAKNKNKNQGVEVTAPPAPRKSTRVDTGKKVS